MRLTVIGSGQPQEIVREGWIHHFPGGEGANNCPRFHYIRDGFGCTFRCSYCYLPRHDFRHPQGAELNPDVEGLYSAVKRWHRRPTSRALILGEVSDGWGWATQDWVLARNLKLIDIFRRASAFLVFLTKYAGVHRLLRGVVPTDRVVLSWSVNAPEVSELYEMGAKQANARIEDARLCREMGWRIRVRLDPMIPIAGWEDFYPAVARRIADEIRPEQVTLGSWRPRSRDPMFRDAEPPLRDLLELGPDGRYRLTNRLAMYRTVWPILGPTIPQLSLCKEELDVQSAIYTEFAVTRQTCNCLDAAGIEPVGLAATSSLLRVLP